MERNTQSTIGIPNPKLVRIVFTISLLIAALFSAQVKADLNAHPMCQQGFSAVSQVQNYFSRQVSETNISILPIDRATGVAITFNMKYSLWFPNKGVREQVRFMTPEQFFFK